MKGPLFKQIRRTERANELRHEAVIGIVVDNKDPDKLGRVKVKFPTINDEETSHWAPISSLGAGKDRGWFFLPEIDDEVLVMFAHGEVSRPVVVGALWNGEDAPPDQNGGGNERRMIVSREGHKIVFDDDAGTITFTDGAGTAKVEMDGSKIVVETSGDAEFAAHSDSLAVKAQTVEMTASMNVTLDASQDISMSGTKVTLSGGSSLQLNGAKVNINPGGTAEAGSADGDCADVPDPAGD
jgi:phage baseplate assembly protein V